MSLWDDTERAIRGQAERDDLQEALLRAGFLFEKALSPKGNPADQAWTEDVVGTAVDRAALRRVRDALVTFVTGHPDDRNVGMAFWALGKLHDRSLLPLLRSSRSRHLDGAPGRDSCPRSPVADPAPDRHTRLPDELLRRGLVADPERLAGQALVVRGVEVDEAVPHGRATAGAQG